MIFIGLLSGRPLRSGPDQNGQGVTFGNSLIAQMGFFLDESIPDNPYTAVFTRLLVAAAE